MVVGAITESLKPLYGVTYCLLPAPSSSQHLEIGIQDAWENQHCPLMYLLWASAPSSAPGEDDVPSPSCLLGMGRITWMDVEAFANGNHYMQIDT